jgi:hypothetical protein
MRTVVEQGLIVSPSADPRDPEQPPIYEAFASAAELRPGVQMALVGGIGSGKTTELRLTLDRLKRYPDAVNLFIEASEFTDFLQTNPGAMLAAIGLRLLAVYQELFGEPPEGLRVVRRKLRELALGKTEWHDYGRLEQDNVPDGQNPLHIPGLMKPRFAQVKDQVSNVAVLLSGVLPSFRKHGKQVTVIVDGLDRLIKPSRFREFAEQDLRAMRGMKVSMILAAPLLLWYDKDRFLQDYFDIVRHIPAASVDPEESGFLKDILERRGAGDLMDEESMNAICRYSGGVLRDLLSLAESAAQYAYRDGEDRIGSGHVQAAVRQLGNRYVAGIGDTQRHLLGQLQKYGQFDVEDPNCRELLVNRQVLEYSKHGLDYFRVHPALAKILP